MYVMACTRLDISNVVNVVNRYMRNLGKMHWEAAKTTLRYLKGTLDVRFVFAKVLMPVALLLGY